MWMGRRYKSENVSFDEPWLDLLSCDSFKSSIEAQGLDAPFEKSWAQLPLSFA
jgi:hypothetical protein